MKKAYLILESGEVFEGNFFGAKKEVIGHMVFNTNMTGYQQIITHPAYADCLTVITYPLIGACGVNTKESTSAQGAARALIVKEYSRTFSHWQADMSLGAFMEEKGIVGIEGVDTRYLTRQTAEKGIQKAMITGRAGSHKSCIDKIRQHKDQKPYEKVSCHRAYKWDTGKKTGKSAAIIDYGITFSLLNSLAKQGYEVKVLPAKSKADEILRENPDLVVASNGPGSPFEADKEITTLSRLLGKKPIAAFGLGGCFLAAALGAKNEALKAGHYGDNKAVKNLLTRQVFMSRQNHRFTVAEKSLPQGAVMLSINLHDDTLESFLHKRFRAAGYFYLPQKLDI